MKTYTSKQGLRLHACLKQLAEKLATNLEKKKSRKEEKIRLRCFERDLFLSQKQECVNNWNAEDIYSNIFDWDLGELRKLKYDIIMNERGFI